MMKGLTLAAAVLLAGCATNDDGEMAGDEAMPREARATLLGPTGTMHGTARIFEDAAGVRLTVSGERLPRGSHGLHVHTVGRCEGPAFESAGPHWNPTARQHGRDNPMGAHAGDAPNLIAGTDGRGSVSIDLPGARLAGVLDMDGSAIVIHAAPDDYRTDPSGNSGGRIACGVFASS